MTEVEKLILDALEQEAPSHGADIVDVEVQGNGRSTVVCVRIDHADEDSAPITLDEVAAHGEWVGELLDELDPIPSSYLLEVSSPGMARPLRRARDFERFAGSTVRLETTATVGRRKYTGKLLGMEDGCVCIECDGERFQIPLFEVKRCTIKPEYDFSPQERERDGAVEKG